jgi:hypothetical protein
MGDWYAFASGDFEGNFVDFELTSGEVGGVEFSWSD